MDGKTAALLALRREAAERGGSGAGSGALLPGRVGLPGAGEGHGHEDYLAAGAMEVLAAECRPASGYDSEGGASSLGGGGPRSRSGAEEESAAAALALAAAAEATESLGHQLAEARAAAAAEASRAAEAQAGEAHWRVAAAAALAALQQQQQEAVCGHHDKENGGGQPAPAGELLLAARRSEVLGRERDALRLILESKVAVLVADIDRSVAELPGPAAAAHPRLGRQLEYLGRLVAATVQAMAAPPAEA